GGDGIDRVFEENVNEFLRIHGCKTKLIKGYGMTELCAAISGSANPKTNKLGSSGIPFAHSIVSVFKPGTEKELKLGETGEICVHSPNAMLGYYASKQETNNVLFKHKDGKIWVHSGDLGYMDNDGCIYIIGRSKRMIIRYDGYKVFPLQIENALCKHPLVKSCCVVAKNDKSSVQGMLPVAFVVADSKSIHNDSEFKKELIRYCHKELVEYAIPADVILIDSLPLSSIGKIDYKKLEDSIN
ncbi:MAG: fatty acid--CoA ligase family protein, partial [Coriobacteriales bacterium]|nr:fatty acid--CoA ligase family protein [Coriobacteriales bacterium]